MSKNQLDKFIESTNALRMLGENVDGAEQVVESMSEGMPIKKRVSKFNSLLPKQTKQEEPVQSPAGYPQQTPYHPTIETAPARQFPTIDDYSAKPVRGI